MDNREPDVPDGDVLDGEALEGEVAAMQFAGGRSMAQVAADWERDIAWAEEAVRRALLRTIPERAGGLMPARDGCREERGRERERLEELQGSLELEL